MKLRYLYGVLLCMLCIFLYLFHLIYSEAREKAIADLNSRQMIHARQAKRGIEDFFTKLNSALTRFSKSHPIVDMDDWGRRTVDLALHIHPEVITTVTRVDADGNIVYTAPYAIGLIGKNISGQSHIRQIMKTQRPVVSSVFTAVQGQKAVALHVPVMKGDEYRGTLGVLIDFRALSRRFLDEIHIGQTGYAWMIDKEGIELYCPVPGHTGKSVYDNCSEFSSILSMADEMVKGRTGTTVYFFDQVRDRQLETIRKHAVYLPVRIGDTFWSIVVAANEDEVLASLVSFRNKLLAVVGLLLVLGCVFLYYVTKVRGIVHEAAARQRAEAALRESEKKYRELFELSPVGIFKTDSKGRALFINPEMARIVGATTPEEAVADFQDLARNLYADPKRREAFIAIMKETGEVENFEYEARRLDGKFIWISMNARTRDISADGSFLIDGFAMDITARKRAEAALRKSDERLRAVFEAATQVSLIITDARDPVPAILEFSPGAEKIFGYSKSEMIGNPVSILHMAGDVAKFPEAHQRMREGQVGFQGETTLIRKSGVRFPALFSTYPLCDETGEMYAAVGVTIDISEQKRLEARLRQAHKMEAIGTLSGGIAHDFNNILFPIQGLAELLMEDLPSQTEAYENALGIYTAAKRAADLVKQILSFARHSDQRKIPVRIQEVLKEALKLSRAMIPSNIEIQTEIETDCGPVVADPTGLHQIAINLVTNAFHAVEETGGAISVRLTETELTGDTLTGKALKPGKYALLSVADTGRGIDPWAITRIFEPYFTTKAQGKGTGLGLSVVYGIVKEHGGDITVHSRVGKGTTFDVFFPLIKKAAATLQAETGEVT